MNGYSNAFVRGVLLSGYVLHRDRSRLLTNWKALAQLQNIWVWVSLYYLLVGGRTRDFCHTLTKRGRMEVACFDLGETAFGVKSIQPHFDRT